MTVQEVLSIARGFIGYREKASNAALDEPSANAGSGNYTRFARDLDAVRGFYNGPKNGAAWCDVFVDACVYYASGEDRAETLRVLCQPEASCGAGCLYSANYYRQAGRWSDKPAVGAQIFFSWAPGEVSHTGLVESVTWDTVTTIEGNSGDAVARRTYKVWDERIVGYGLPRYEDEPAVPPQTGTYTVRAGDTIWGIAQAHGITMSALAELNGISINAMIHPGDVLKVPESGPSGTPAPALEELVAALEKRVRRLEAAADRR